MGHLPSFHFAHYPSSCTEEPDVGCPEDLGDRHDPLEEEVDVVESDDQPPSMGTGAYTYCASILFLYIRRSFCVNSTRC